MRINPETMAAVSSRHPWRTLAAWLALIVAMAIVSARLLSGVMTNDVHFTNDPESVRAQDVIDAKFSAGAPKDTEFLVVSSHTQKTWDPSYPEFVQGLKDDVQRLGPSVIAGPVSTYVDAEAQAKLLYTPDDQGVLVLVQLSDDRAATVNRVASAAAEATPDGFAATAMPLAQLTAAAPQGAAAMAANPPELIEVVSSPTLWTTDPAFPDATKRVEIAITKAAGASLAAPPFSGFEASAQATSLVSADSGTTLVAVPIVDITEDIVTKLRDVAGRASNGTYTVQVAGQAALYADFMKLAEEDMRKSENIGLGIALIVLIVVFASVVAAVLPIVMGLCAIAAALGLVALIGQVFEFNLFVSNIVTMIGLAVGIDYSLFIVSRYREERKKGFEKLEAIRRSGATANRAVFFSGTTVVLALCGMLIIPVSIFQSLAGGAIVVTIVSIAASMTLLPAILSLLGDRVNWPRLAKRARVDADHDPHGGFWDRMTRSVMARPVVYLLASVLVLGGLGSFYFQLHRGTNQSVSQLPAEFPSRQAFLMLVREFNAGGVTDPARIVVTGNVDQPATREAIASLRGAVAKDRAFSPFTVVEPSEDGTVYMITAYFRGDTMTDQAFQTIRDLRSTIVPAAFARVSGVSVLVGGNTAFFTDFLKIADDYQWVVLAFVLTLSFILLTIVFRSIVVPINAIIMNLLSVAAAYGAVTLVFQKGVGIGLFNAVGFDFKKADAIEAWLPLFLFSILFGLSMDYHVFLLTRIREEYDKSHDNAEAVAYGLRTTAGIITGAALIMCAVFVAFAMGRMGQFQQMGFGLAVAVFVDATIVRTVLVPSTMRLLGDVNWYLPRWLRWLPELHVEGGEEPPTLLTVPFPAPAVPQRSPAAED
ncbi:MAG: MMPL family transporter [Actinomycetota bacterium]